MIPSVYSEVEAYKREGRINADAAYKVLQVSEQRAQRTGMQKYIEYQLDCMACVDEVLPNFFKRGYMLVIWITQHTISFFHRRRAYRLFISQAATCHSFIKVSLSNVRTILLRVPRYPGVP